MEREGVHETDERGCIDKVRQKEVFGRKKRRDTFIQSQFG